MVRLSAQTPWTYQTFYDRGRRDDRTPPQFFIHFIAVQAKFVSKFQGAGIVIAIKLKQDYRRRLWKTQPSSNQQEGTDDRVLAHLGQYKFVTVQHNNEQQASDILYFYLKG